MNKEIVCVYQDCVMCGDKGKILKQKIAENKLNVRKVSFASEEGRGLVAKAVFSHGIKVMPFYTDGDKFATDISAFVEKCDKNVKKVRKKVIKKSKKEGK